jgi:hypothetical protein
MLKLKDEIENNNNFYKIAKKKIRNQNNEGYVGKHNTINLNLKVKLKTIETFAKKPRKKNRNPKNKDEIEECNI